MSNKARRSRVVKPDVLVVGIDVAKRRHVAVCRRPDGFKEKAFAFTNQRSGFEKLGKDGAIIWQAPKPAALHKLISHPIFAGV